MDLDWNRLISDRRYSQHTHSSPGPKYPAADPFRSAFEADYDRAIYSKAFRRLGKKTQVHPMEMNAHIHNRLTHSLEVASVGRSFARRLADLLTTQHQLPCRCPVGCSPQQRCPQTVIDFDYTLMSACLLHDIGNPPFGHAGEYSIREWSQQHVTEIFPGQQPNWPAGLQHDVHIFEGNAQGFRLAARYDVPSAGYIRATYTTLGAMVKYPWDSSDARASELGKFNFFSTERTIAESVFGELGLYDGTDFARHPMSFLSEAADDICYRVIDIEDAVEMKIVPIERAVELYLLLLGETAAAKHQSMNLSQLRATVVGHLIEQLWNVFEQDYDRIMRGQRIEDLKAGVHETLQSALTDVKETNHRIYSTEKKIRVEIGAYKILGSIIKALSKATQTYARQQNLQDIPFIARRCLELAWPEAYLVDNAHQPYAWWIHEILDFVSGLTDDHACEVSDAIQGIGH